MAEPHPPHFDERLGHVAVEMGLLNARQVDDINFRIGTTSADLTGEGNFGRFAVDMGYLTPGEVEALENEERRRRRLINGYEIIDIIGKGNVSTVYRAVQLAMDREVALKILHTRLASDPVFVHAYIAEAQAVSRFHHPNIVQGFDAGESNGFYYFAHEYLSGGSMASRLAAGAAGFSETGLLTCLRQTTAGLRHAWEVAVYHGDINPGNLLMDGQDTIKLANLGVPRVAILRGAGQDRTPGFVRCGPDYAAPEQLDRPEAVTPEADIYSLGATFYHLSFGVPPFPGANQDEVLELRRFNPMPPFSLSRQEAFSPKYLHLIHDMLNPDPKKRPANPEVLADRLEKFHLPGDDEMGLARQVRQVVGPTDSHAHFRRSPIRVTAPNPNRNFDRLKFSLLRRRLKRGRSAAWFIIAVAAVTALALLRFLG